MIFIFCWIVNTGRFEEVELPATLTKKSFSEYLSGKENLPLYFKWNKESTKDCVCKLYTFDKIRHFKQNGAVSSSKTAANFYTSIEVDFFKTFLFLSPRRF